MRFLTRIDAHADLMHRMADAVQADLTDALVKGRLSAPELRNAVMACTGCEGSDECRTWLEVHQDGAADTPSWCRNRDLLMRLSG